MERYARTELLLGENNMRLLARARVAVFGLGGVGSYVVEGLARSGVGSLILVDNDQVSETNINRQLYALTSTIGQPKTEVAKQRIRDIDDQILVHTYQTFYNQDTASMFDFKSYDYVVDAIDTVSSKLLLIEQAKAAGVPILSCMGTGNKLNPREPVAARKGDSQETKGTSGHPVPGSISFVPSVAGLMIAGEVIRDLTGIQLRK